MKIDFERGLKYNVVLYSIILLFTLGVKKRSSFLIFFFSKINILRSSIICRRRTILRRQRQ